MDFPTPTSNQNSNAIAVVFGIEDYRNAPTVSYAVNDADIFREYLIKRFGFRRENIHLRLDEQSTKGQFDKVFSQNGWIYLIMKILLLYRYLKCQETIREIK